MEKPKRLPAIGPKLAAAFMILTVVEAVVFGTLLYRRSAAPSPITLPPLVDARAAGDVALPKGRPAGVTAPKLKAGSETRTIPLVHRGPPVEAHGTPPAATRPSVATKTAAAAKNDTDAAAIASAPVPERSGRLKIVSPIELEVIEGQRVLGSSSEGPVETTPGIHQLDFVNSALGYKSRQTVEIKAGQVVSLEVTPPMGRVSINAVPWAQVWIDGRLVGETPLANLSVPAGDHEVIFRHPQLGDFRQTASVRSGALTRVTATLAQ